MIRGIEFSVAEATSEDGRGWYWHLTLTKHDCLIGPFATEKDATKDALETIVGRAVLARVDAEDSLDDSHVAALAECAEPVGRVVIRP
jgi:hypothetical protein